MIFPQCQSSLRDATRIDGAKVQFNYEFYMMKDEKNAERC